MNTLRTQKVSSAMHIVAHTTSGHCNMFFFRSSVIYAVSSMSYQTGLLPDSLCFKLGSAVNAKDRT